MGVAVLNPQDCLKQPFSHMKYPRNHTACPNRQKKPVPNRTRRSPPRNQTARSPPEAPPPPPPPQPAAAVSSFVPKGTVKKSPIAGQVRILKRGEEIPKKTEALVVEKPDLVSTERFGPDPCLIPSQIRLSDRKSKKTVLPFYAGPVTMTSPPPSDVPLPAFFTPKKSVADATNHIIRLLGIEIA